MRSELSAAMAYPVPLFYSSSNATNEQPRKLQSARSRFYLIGITVAV
jgi:hypothetical protein